MGLMGEMLMQLKSISPKWNAKTRDALYIFFMIKVTAAAMLIIIITKKTVKVIFFIVATKCSINLMNVTKM